MAEQSSWLFSSRMQKRSLPQVRTPHEQTALERHIEATDRQIDALVYKLYGLTEEEIGIAEGRACITASIHRVPFIAE